MVPSKEIAFEMYESAFRPYVNDASFVSAGVWSSPIVVHARVDAIGKRYVVQNPSASEPVVAPPAAPGIRRGFTRR